MTKFDEAVRTLSAVSNVADNIQYRINDIENDKSYYQEKLAEDESNEYWQNNIAELTAKQNVYKELLVYLEKKYLK